MTRPRQGTATESEARVRLHGGRRLIPLVATAAALIVGIGGALLATWHRPTRGVQSSGALSLVAESAAGITIRPSVGRSFIANRGQWHPAVRFLARRGGETAFFSPDAITLTRAPDADPSSSATERILWRRSTLPA